MLKQICSVFTMLALLAAPANAAPKKQKPAYPVGAIDAVEGEVGLRRLGNSQTVAAQQPVNAGDEVSTSSEGKVRIILNDKSVLALGPDSTVIIKDMKLTKNRFALINVLTGKFWLQVTKFVGKGKNVFQVSTPNAVAGVRGTTLWGDTEVDMICALEGVIELKSIKGKKRKGKGKPFKAGNCGSELSQGKVTPYAPSAEQVQDYLNQVLIH